MNTDPPTYTVARCLAAGGTLAAILAWPMSERYGATAGVCWLLVAILGLFGAWYDQIVVRRSRARRRAYKRSQETTVWLEGNVLPIDRAATLRANAFSVAADLLIQEDHRRIRLAEVGDPRD